MEVKVSKYKRAGELKDEQGRVFQVQYILDFFCDGKPYTAVVYVWPDLPNHPDELREFMVKQAQDLAEDGEVI